VNLEHWTILIYFYFAIIRINPLYYCFPNNNSFITVLKMGHKSAIKLLPYESQIYEDVIFNGFTTYYRILFSVAIFSKGKAFDFSMLCNTLNLEISKIKVFLTKFNLLVSLNYDNILENIVDDRVEHLHGVFVRDKTEYVYSQSLGLEYDNGYVSFSELMIGDYFIFKSFLPVVNNLVKNHINKSMTHFSKKMDELIEVNSINNVIIFGMNIENDQHVLRNLMLAFYNAQQKNPHIIYCYYNPEERKEFAKQFKGVITFSKEVNEYVENIEVSYIRTQELLKEYFLKISK